ncbi:MAG: hypothetical protein ABIN01_09605 [Ferruginibacter sp.]
MQSVKYIKIIFLCGSLETGRDGVGDYTRILACELIKKGHNAGIIALNDSYLSEELNTVLNFDTIDLPVLRLPAQWPSTKRFQRAGLWMEAFNPDWISLQFVPFAFHSKGLALRMAKQLLKLGNGRHWHIMVHELWVGMDEKAPRKFIYLGWLQRQLIKYLFFKLRPVVIHTQANLYLKLLDKIGIKAQYLPLFGNISLTPVSTGENYLPTGNLPSLKSLVLFGGIHFGAPVSQLVKDLAAYSKENNVQVSLTIIGRCGAEQDRWVAEWKSAGLFVQVLGEQESERVSAELNKANVGIATTPAALIDKSGSVAAMIEHGLPVLCVSKEWKPRGINHFKLPPGVMVYKQGNPQTIFSIKKMPGNPTHISTITDQFVNNLLSV